MPFFLFLQVGSEEGLRALLSLDRKKKEISPLHQSSLSAKFQELP
jgi:hypothetical protein